MLFILVGLFFLLHINANFFFGGQQSPFFYWNLYATPVSKSDSVSFYEIRYNGNKVLLLNQTRKQPGNFLLLNPLFHYVSMISNHGKDILQHYIDNWNSSYPWLANLTPGIKFYPDSSDLKKFPSWFVDRMESYQSIRIQSMDIYKITVRYAKNGRVQPVSEQFICKIK